MLWNHPHFQDPVNSSIVNNSLAPILSSSQALQMEDLLQGYIYNQQNWLQNEWIRRRWVLEWVYNVITIKKLTVLIKVHIRWGRRKIGKSSRNATLWGRKGSYSCFLEWWNSYLLILSHSSLLLINDICTRMNLSQDSSDFKNSALMSSYQNNPTKQTNKQTNNPTSGHLHWMLRIGSSSKFCMKILW